MMSLPMALLRLDAALRAQAHDRLIHVALEFRTFLVDGPAARQREDLESARIGEHRARPIHESMDAAEPLEELGTGSQHQMVGVRKQYLRAALQQVLAPLRPNRGMSAHRHEGRGKDFVMQCFEAPRAGS